MSSIKSFWGKSEVGFLFFIKDKGSLSAELLSRSTTHCTNADVTWPSSSHPVKLHFGEPSRADPQAIAIVVTQPFTLSLTQESRICEDMKG